MKVAHLCLSCFFIDGHSYQENELVRQHCNDGHEVLVLASTESFSPDGLITYVAPSEYLGGEGAIVKRLPYRGFLPNILMAKLRLNVGVYEALAEFGPQIILFHGTCGWELRTAVRYVIDNPGVLLYVDSHEDWNNSARGFVSRELLHRHYYGPILRGALPYIKKVLCISTESIEFVRSLYGVPASKIEFFPLGGRPIPEEEYWLRRQKGRRAYGIEDGNVLLVQSGKQTRKKKLLQSLRAFRACLEPKLRFIIVGALQEDIRDEAEVLIAADKRIRFLGWKSPQELTDLLCSADVYLQPGTQSVTMQHSLCAHCAIVIDDVPAHRFYLHHNGWLISDSQPLEFIFRELVRADLTAMQNNSFQLAKEHLDYSILSRRVLV